MPQKIKSLFNVLDLGLLTVESEPQSIQPLLGNPEILFGIFGAQNHKVSSPGEFRPEALSEPYMNLSAHTAPTMAPRRTPICQ